MCECACVHTRAPSAVQLYNVCRFVSPRSRPSCFSTAASPAGLVDAHTHPALPSADTSREGRADGSESAEPLETGRLCSGFSVESQRSHVCRGLSLSVAAGQALSLCAPHPLGVRAASGQGDAGEPQGPHFSGVNAPECRCGGHAAVHCVC